MTSQFLRIAPGHAEFLAMTGDTPEAVHVFDGDTIAAVNAALAARRPLLVRGEPGVGKSQLARAVAKVQGWAYVQHVVDARTESRDLLWEFDAVQRLADAQLRGALGAESHYRRVGQAAWASCRAGTDLSVRNYLKPGPLWWAFDWRSALGQAHKLGMAAPPQLDKGDPAKGCLILVDEIDKAETDVPNGLLEALGMGCFTPQGWREPVKMLGKQTMVVITTNEERVLPDAFIRRCLVLPLTLPKDSDKLIEALVELGRAHFGGMAGPLFKCNGDAEQKFEAFLRKAAMQLNKDRQNAREAHYLPLPGLAEYLDLLRAVLELASHRRTTPDDILTEIAPFVFQKHRGAPE